MKLLNLTDLNHLAHDLRQIIDRAVLAGSEVSYLQNAALILEEVAALSHPVVQPRLTTMDAPAHYTSVQSRAWAAGVIAAVPPGYVLVPIDPTQGMITAMSTSKAKDSEGEFPMLLDLIDYSGENKTYTVLKAAYAAMLATVPTPKEPT